MSTIKVSNIQNASASSAAITLDTSGNAAVNASTINGLNYPTAGPLSNRNLIINGAMQVAQRGTSQTGITSSTYAACDRFRTIVGGSLGTWTAAQDTNAPNGFSNSFKLTCTSGVASPAANGIVQVRYYVEAQDLQSLGFGTADAKSTTMSFWVRSNKTGNASFTIEQRDNSSKQVSYQYSISSADTWEYKTITIPGDTAGVIDNDNGQGFEITWTLYSGTNYSSGSHSSTWTTYSDTNFNPSNLGVGGATNDYFQITGVQLEVGSVATPFEHRSYGDELARCQRYYYAVYRRGASSDGNIALPGMASLFDVNLPYTNMPFPVTMRTGPGVETPNRTDAYVYPVFNSIMYAPTVSIVHAHSNGCTLTSTLTANNIGGRASNPYMNTANWVEGDILAFAAEL